MTKLRYISYKMAYANSNKSLKLKGQQDQYNPAVTVTVPENNYRVHQKLYEQYKSAVNLKDEYETRIIPENAETGNVLRRDTILMTKETPRPAGNYSGTKATSAPKRYVTFYQENVYKRENSNEHDGLVGGDNHKSRKEKAKIRCTHAL